MIFDILRAAFVEATPEEKVRQRLIHYMLYEGAYPKAAILVERGIDTLPFRKPGGRQDSRIDLLVLHQAKPLLLIECKREDSLALATSQVFAYNEYVDAPFLAVAGPTTIVTYWKDAKGWNQTPGLPHYTSLLDAISSSN